MEPSEITFEEHPSRLIKAVRDRKVYKAIPTILLLIGVSVASIVVRVSGKCTKENMVDSLVWVPTQGNKIPENAVLGGQEAYGKPLFVARAMHDGYWCPGKAGYHLGGCHTGSNGIEREYNDYEVLTLPPKADVTLSWQKCFYGNMPTDGLCANPTLKLYIGRHFHAGAIVPGKIDLKKRAIYVTSDWREHEYPSYEALVVSRMSHQSRYNLYNINYDLLTARVHTDETPVVIATQRRHNSRDHEITIPVTASCIKSHQWVVQERIENAGNIEIKGGTPKYIDSRFKISDENIVNIANGQTIQENVNIAAEPKIALPPRTTMDISILGKTENIDIPFTANLTETADDGKSRTCVTSGVYYCIFYTDFHTSAKNI